MKYYFGLIFVLLFSIIFLFNCYYEVNCNVINNEAEVLFCEEVDDEGEPVNISSEFHTNEYFHVLLQKPQRLGISTIVIYCYLMEDEKKIFVARMEKEVDPEWNVIYRKTFLREEGTYKFVFSDLKDNKLGKGKVDIINNK